MGVSPTAICFGIFGRWDTDRYKNICAKILDELKTSYFQTLPAISSLMHKISALLNMQLVLVSCNVPLKQNKINKWFYGIPVYDNPNEITRKLLLDSRFSIEEFPDTTKDAYIYKARINNLNIPLNNVHSDSSVIDFTFFKIKSKTYSVTSKLLYVNHYSANLNDLENLYNASYSDLKSVLNDAHDIIETTDDDTSGVGKKIFYVCSDSASYTIEIIKKKHPNGSKSVEFMSGERSLWPTETPLLHKAETY